MDYVYVVMCYDENSGLYDKLSTIFKYEVDAFMWIDTNAEDKSNYKVECWKVN